jgi:hypothetical protein
MRIRLLNMTQIHADPDLDQQHWRKEGHGARKELLDGTGEDERMAKQKSSFFSQIFWIIIYHTCTLNQTKN